MDISPTATRISFVQWSGYTAQSLEFDFTDDYSSVYYGVKGVTQSGGSTFWPQAVGFFNGNVAPSIRAGVKKVIVMMTDGNSLIPPGGETTALKDNGMLIYTVGSGTYVESQLNTISSDPDAEFVYADSSWDYLETVYLDIAKSICEA